MSERDQQHDRTVLDGLKLLRCHLQLVHDGIVVAAAALNRQNADRDKEIARVLEHLIGERLLSQIERASLLLDVVEASGSRPTHIDGHAGQDDVPHGVREPKLLPLWHGRNSNDDWVARRAM